MGRYVTQRILLSGLTLLLVTVIVFTLLRVVVPLVYADAVDVIAGDLSQTDPVRAAELRDEYGLGGNIGARYLEWVGGIFQGDLGESIQNGRAVTTELRQRLPVSFELGLVGLLAGLIVSIPMGIMAALYQDRWPDYVFRTLAILLSAMPAFWLAILIITFGSVWFNWAPPLKFQYFWDDPAQHVKIMALPALLIGLTPSAGLTRVVRTQMLEVMRQDYIRTARAKGLTSRVVVVRHALRNALIPVVTVVGLSLPNLVAGTAIFESIFGLPGMGQYLVSSVSRLDYPVIQSTNLMFAVLIVLANLAVDISYPFFDPRIKY